MSTCVRHYEEPAVAACRSCQRSFCGRCVVYSFGPRKPPYCVGCALAASGVRSGVPKPSAPEGEVPVFAPPPEAQISRREARTQRREEKAAQKLARKENRGRRGEPTAPSAAISEGHATVLYGIAGLEAPSSGRSLEERGTPTAV